MDATEYEHHVAAILRGEGWRVTVTPPSGDFGIDVLAERDGVRLGVQAKMYGRASRPINAEHVMLTYGAAAYADCSAAMIATDADVLPRATEVATKLGVTIRRIPAGESLRDLAPCAVEAAVPDLGGVVSAMTFGEVWTQVQALVGTTLTRGGGKTNRILSVDGGGITRITSNGRTQHIRVEAFRWAIERLLQGNTVLREDINANCGGRSSSGVLLVLASLPVFEPTTVGTKQGVRLRRT